MPAPYNEDLRRKAVAAVKRGEQKTDVSKMFHISRNTLDLWVKREQETGDCQAITNFQQGCRHKITDWERFEAFVVQHNGKTQAEMAKLWGDGVTQQNMSAAIKKLVCRVNYFWASRQLEQMLKSLQIYSDRISV